MTQTPDIQAIVAAVLEKLKEPAEPRSFVPRQGKTRMKEVPITAREDPDIDPYEALPPINRETHEYVFCKNGRWRAVPKQTPEQIKERTEKMLESRLRKRAEATKRLEDKLAQIRVEKMEESVVEEPVEKKAPEPTSDSGEAIEHDEIDPEVAKMVADHIAERQCKEESTRMRNSASSSVFGVTVTHK